MDCQTMMTASPHALRGTDTVRAAINAMLEHRVSALPVLDGEGRYLGVVSVPGLFGLALPRVVRATTAMRDLAFLHEALPDIKRRLAENADAPVTAILQVDAPLLKADTSLIEAMLYFYRGHSMLPVVDPVSKKLLGVVTRVAALKLLAERL